jgi:hypothetical protein
MISYYFTVLLVNMPLNRWKNIKAIRKISPPNINRSTLIQLQIEIPNSDNRLAIITYIIKNILISAMAMVRKSFLVKRSDAGFLVVGSLAKFLMFVFGVGYAMLIITSGISNFAIQSLSNNTL